jgi:spore coat polysaccharide biosynthesis protein SpsF
MNRVLAIIQARMGSNRLPGKVMKDIGGETMLARVVKRTKRAELLDNVVVATTVDPRDDVIVNECQRLDVPVCRGKESDVLDRYYQAALLHRSDTIVRITSDSPLIDPAVVDKIISAFLSENPDYASNVVERTYPMGLDTEVMSMSTLKRAWEEARQAYERVHVTPYIYENPELFRLLHVKGEADYSHYRWTVDVPEDLAFVRAVYHGLGNNEFVRWKDVVDLLEKDPSLAEMNQHVRQKALLEC